jgi:hypothetical protein
MREICTYGLTRRRERPVRPSLLYCVPWFQGLSDETEFVVWKSLEELETQRHRGHGEKKERGEGEKKERRRRGEGRGGKGRGEFGG